MRNHDQTNQQPDHQSKRPQAPAPVQATEPTNLSFLYGSIASRPWRRRRYYSDTRPVHAQAVHPHRPALRRIRSLAAHHRAPHRIVVRRPRATAAVIICVIGFDHRRTADAGHFFLRDRCDQAKSGAADHSPARGKQPGHMLAAYVPPRPLARTPRHRRRRGDSRETRYGSISSTPGPGRTRWSNVSSASPCRPARRCWRSSLEPALRREPRALHDGDADVQFRHVDTPKTTPVTFILSGHRLVTVRYDDPRRS